MPVRVEPRVAQQRGDAQRDVVGNRVLDSFGLGVNGLERHVKDAVQERLKESMTAHH